MHWGCQSYRQPWQRAIAKPRWKRFEVYRTGNPTVSSLARTVVEASSQPTHSDSAEPMPRPIPVHRRVLFLSVPYIIVALLLLGIEGATRLLLPHISFLDVLIQPQSLRPDISQQGSTIFEGDPLLFWRVRPNLKEVAWDFTSVSTNAQGLRHEGDIARKPDGEFRIVCLGDSVTFGYRVPLVFPEHPHEYARDQLPYPLQLEKQLRAANPGKKIDVLPLAVPAYTSLQGLNWLKRDIDWLKPDVVTVCFGWNDVCLRSVPDRLVMPTDWLHVTVRSLMEHSQALIQFAHWSHTQRVKKHAENAAFTTPRVPPADYVANLLETARVTRDHHAQPLIIAPVYRDALANPSEAALIKKYRDALRDAATTNGIPYLEIGELTETNYPANIPLFGELIHPSYEGHKVIAREVLKFLAAHQTLGPLNLPENP
jgi:lysophospholipase L1-like esterase